MAVKNVDIRILQSIVCDEIRREDNGKFMLMGVYPDAIFMNIIPADLIVSLWIQCKMDLKKKVTLEFEVDGDAIVKPISFVSEVGDDQIFSKSITLPIVLRVILTVKNEGDIFFKYRQLGETTWNIVNKIGVKKNISTLPTFAKPSTII